jgi:hypothetical protein
MGWPATPESRCLAAVREWLYGISRRNSPTVSVRKVVADLTAILALVPVAAKPVRGPFASPGGDRPMRGRAEYLGGGMVRLDDTAISSLAGLLEGEDFRVTYTDSGPVLTVGADTYPAREEEPDIKP